MSRRSSKGSIPGRALRYTINNINENTDERNYSNMKEKEGKMQIMKKNEEHEREVKVINNKEKNKVVNNLRNTVSKNRDDEKNAAQLRAEIKSFDKDSNKNGGRKRKKRSTKKRRK